MLHQGYMNKKKIIHLIIIKVLKILKIIMKIYITLKK